MGPFPRSHLAATSKLGPLALRSEDWRALSPFSFSSKPRRMHF